MWPIRPKMFWPISLCLLTYVCSWTEKQRGAPRNLILPFQADAKTKTEGFTSFWCYEHPFLLLRANTWIFKYRNRSHRVHEITEWVQHLTEKSKPHRLEISNELEKKKNLTSTQDLWAHQCHCRYAVWPILGHSHFLRGEIHGDLYQLSKSMSDRGKAVSVPDQWLWSPKHWWTGTILQTMHPRSTRVLGQRRHRVVSFEMTNLNSLLRHAVMLMTACLVNQDTWCMAKTQKRCLISFLTWVMEKESPQDSSPESPGAWKLELQAVHKTPLSLSQYQPWSIWTVNNVWAWCWKPSIVSNVWWTENAACLWSGYFDIPVPNTEVQIDQQVEPHLSFIPTLKKLILRISQNFSDWSLLSIESCKSVCIKNR
jgi:hypothetical protein